MSVNRFVYAEKRFMLISSGILALNCYLFEYLLDTRNFLWNRGIGADTFLSMQEAAHYHRGTRHLHEAKDKFKAIARPEEPISGESISIAHPSDQKAIRSANAADEIAQFVMSYRTPDSRDTARPRSPEHEPVTKEKKRRRWWLCCFWFPKTTFLFLPLTWGGAIWK